MSHKKIIYWIIFFYVGGRLRYNLCQKLIGNKFKNLNEFSHRIKYFHWGNRFSHSLIRLCSLQWVENDCHKGHFKQPGEHWMRQKYSTVGLGDRVTKRLVHMQDSLGDSRQSVHWLFFILLQILSPLKKAVTVLSSLYVFKYNWSPFTELQGRKQKRGYVSEPSDPWHSGRWGVPSRVCVSVCLD